ncbi:hypothetical protein H6758_03030 [Candidatus Nomurabacteria bacterium]|nr:hypothetical protein [Candidatus Nomurabacteria bacterium]
MGISVTINKGKHSHPIPDGAKELLEEFFGSAGLEGEITVQQGAAVKGTAHLQGLTNVSIKGISGRYVIVRVQPGNNTTGREYQVVTPNNLSPQLLFRLLKSTAQELKEGGSNGTVVGFDDLQDQESQILRQIQECDDELNALTEKIGQLKEFVEADRLPLSRLEQKIEQVRQQITALQEALEGHRRERNGLEEKFSKSQSDLAIAQHDYEEAVQKRDALLERQHALQQLRADRIVEIVLDAAHNQSVDPNVVHARLGDLIRD